MTPPPAYERATPMRPALIYRGEAPWLYSITDEIAARGGVPPVALFFRPGLPLDYAAASPRGLFIELSPAAFALPRHHLAALLAHEMGHIAQRHDAPAWLRRGFRPVALLALAALVAWGPAIALVPWAAAVVAREAWLRAMVHAAEREADEWAASIVGAPALVALGVAMREPLSARQRRWGRIANLLAGYPNRRPWLARMADAAG